MSSNKSRKEKKEIGFRAEEEKRQVGSGTRLKGSVRKRPEAGGDPIFGGARTAKHSGCVG